MFNRVYVFCIGLLLATSGVRAEDSSARLSFKGQVLQTDLKLEDAVTRAITEERQYEGTCYRDVLDGYEESCEDVPYEDCGLMLEALSLSCHDEPSEVCGPRGCTPITRRVCDGGGGSSGGDSGGGSTYDPPTCHTRYEHRCHSEPRYRSEPYTCTKTETVVVGHELVEHIAAFVHVEVREAGLPSGNSVDDRLDLLLNGRNLRIGATVSPVNGSSYSGDHLLYEVLERDLEVLEKGPKEVQVNARYVLRPVRLGAVAQALNEGAKDLHIQADRIQFSTTMPLGEALVAHLELRKDRKIIWDKRLFKGSLKHGQLELDSAMDGTFHQVSIPLAVLGIPSLDQKRVHEARVSLGLDLELAKAKLINPEDLPSAKDKTFKVDSTPRPNVRELPKP